MFGEPDRGLQRMLGILGDEKRIYRFQEGEVTREEFEHCQLIDQVVFGPKGYVESLGPTWYMIHDPRFNAIEGKFIQRRPSVLGGDATLGRQYIDDKGNFSSSIVDLEQYSNILGEGRNLFIFLQHPDEWCPERRWLERTWKPNEAPKAGPEVACTCTSKRMDPRTWKDQDDDTIWALIKREWPNYFRRSGLMASAEEVMADIARHSENVAQGIRSETKLINREAVLLYDLSKADLVGLIADYAETPMADDWTVADAESAASAQQMGLADEAPVVALEVDYLEKALTYRASLRATAAKLLHQIGFMKQLKELEKSKGKAATRLTDSEADTILRMVYQSNYPDGQALLVANLMQYMTVILQTPFEERLAEQARRASETAQKVIAGLKDGSVLPVNQNTDAEPEDERTVEKRYEDFVNQCREEDEEPVSFEQWYEESYKPTLIFTAIFKNPRKKDLYMTYSAAEQEYGSPDGDPRAGLVVQILAPVFEDPNYLLDEPEYARLQELVRKTGYGQLETKAYAEEWHAKDSYHKGEGDQLDPKTLEPLPQGDKDAEIAKILEGFKPKDIQ